MTASLAPFPWFGGKSRAAHLVWGAFGDVGNYVEPFAGSLAVLLARPTPPRIETVNDLDCYLANFWRAVQADPGKTSYYADWPVNEADLQARHTWLINQVDFRERMKSDPDFYDAKVAGWWVWGQSAWIGQGWCRVTEGRTSPVVQLPELGGRGAHGKGVHRLAHSRLPHLGSAGQGVHSMCKQKNLDEYMLSLAERLRRTRVACGDWTRVTTKAVTFGKGMTGVLLDPPYDTGADLYSVRGQGVASAVRAWCAENGDNPQLRIALCGREGDPELPGWRKVAWKAHGGYSKPKVTGNASAKIERIWFSPACLSPEGEP